ncbi:hypothetical protein AAFN90_13055 [Erwiniaceae bacterium CAU 1747]
MRHWILPGGLLVFSLFIAATALSESTIRVYFQGTILAGACSISQSAGELQMQCAPPSGCTVVQRQQVAPVNQNRVSPQQKIRIRWLNDEITRGIATLTQV